ncbi:MAG: hypothetical protein KDD70_02850 [Bdellovibrionales bacterium]|nr:hypothetical protein [Bdellovibrionales bacterium]
MPPKKSKTPQQVQGGMAFFASYLVLLALSCVSVKVLIIVLLNSTLGHLLFPTIGVILGWWAGYTLFRGQPSVLLHEYKHAILATLIGNKWKKLKLDGMSGAFHYTYTKDTAEYNAFISLAPYFLPVLTLLGLLLYAIVSYHSLEGAIIITTAFHGAEIYFNLKDASPIQTDLTDIRGGYYSALGYIAVSNTFITSMLFIWIIGGPDGLQLWLDGLWGLGVLLVAAVRAGLIPSS